MAGISIPETQIASLLSDVPDGAFGVAVSGGGDSVALLRLVSELRNKTARGIHVATVNHNLRPEAHSEARFVADLCKTLDLPHKTLSWDDWDGLGNLQNAARNARKTLLAQWAQGLGLKAVMLGHTSDDQAETFLMRLARGSGVDGLSGMKETSGSDPVWLRPLLGNTRNELRTYLNQLGQKWIEDPSNDDEQFDRISMRKALPMLAELGLTTKRLAQTATGLQFARNALEMQTRKALQTCSVLDRYGAVHIDATDLQAAPLEIQYRVLSHAILSITSAPYRPRFSALKAAYTQLLQKKSQTLAGCYIKSIDGEQFIVMREIANMPASPLKNGIYDSRWAVSCGRIHKNAQIRSLGPKGLQQVENWRDLGVLRDILLQIPAIWLENSVICAPLVGIKGTAEILLNIDQDQFYSDVVSH